MIGLMLVTHGRLGDALLETLEHVAGPQAQIGVVGVADDDDPAQLRPAAERLVRGLDTGDGVLILTDIFGGSPSNLALSLREDGRVEVVSGVNVPMLVKLAKIRRERDLAGCVDMATMAGRKYIAIASQLPGECLHGGPRACTAGVSHSD